MMQPNASSNRRRISTGRAAPPEMQTRRAEVSNRPRSGTVSRAPYIVGTPANTVTWCAVVIVSACSGSNRGSRVTQAPAETAAFSVQV